MWRLLLIAVIVAVLVIGASIGYFNAQRVEFDYLFGRWDAPLIALLIVDFALGVVVALLLAGSRLFAQSLELRRLRARLRDHEAELRNLRNLPLPAEPGAGPQQR